MLNVPLSKSMRNKLQISCVFHGTFRRCRRSEVFEQATNVPSSTILLTLCLWRWTEKPQRAMSPGVEVCVRAGCQTFFHARSSSPFIVLPFNLFDDRAVCEKRRQNSSKPREPEPRQVPHVAIPATGSRAQHILCRGLKPPGGSGMNFSEHSGAPTWGGGHAQGAHPCLRTCVSTLVICWRK